MLTSYSQHRTAIQKDIFEVFKFFERATFIDIQLPSSSTLKYQTLEEK